MTDRDAAAVRRALLEDAMLDDLIRELWRRGFVVVPWEENIAVASVSDDGEALTA